MCACACASVWVCICVCVWLCMSVCVSVYMSFYECVCVFFCCKLFSKSKLESWYILITKINKNLNCLLTKYFEKALTRHLVCYFNSKCSLRKKGFIFCFELPLIVNLFFLSLYLFSAVVSCTMAYDNLMWFPISKILFLFLK